MKLVFKNSLKELKKLSTSAKQRKKSRSFNIESFKLVKEMAASNYRVELILVSES